jgi:nucleoside-diphosphate-sugar epimerase
MQEKTLILGACGQIGSELVSELRKLGNAESIIASDIRPLEGDSNSNGPFEILDATDYFALEDIVAHYEIDTIYLMAAMLSATAEKFPMKAWHLNMTSLFNVLNLAKEGKIKKVFWPSSIAVYGSNCDKKMAPQHGIIEPNTVYGISKLSGENWCDYYCKKYGVDVRSIRYPGLISWKTTPGGGTTDYANAIFSEALEKKSYSCYLEADTRLPMMYMDDAIRATIQLMNAPIEKVQLGLSYNIASMSFSPSEIAREINNHLPLKMGYQIDSRQEIAMSWPENIDDQEARKDWGWAPNFDLEKTVTTMLKALKN